MPTYELSLLIRAMPREELFSSLKRAATVIFEKGGFIRKINNLGKMPTPYRVTGSDGVHREGNYFVFEFEAAPGQIQQLNSAYERDVDLLISRIFKQEKFPQGPCTLDDELKPPAYRKEVQEMIEIANKRKRKFRACAYKMNSNLAFNPFQR